jgi:tetratricopeptide (TPR) repeat protein
MMPKTCSMLIWLISALNLAGCSGFIVGQQVQAGRNALQSGRPESALAFLVPAAETDPNYTIPYRFPESVLTYLGRAYYETAKYPEARDVLQKAVGGKRNDNLAKVYLGLTLMRLGQEQQGRKEVEDGLRGIHDDLEFIAADNVNGIYWDPARSIRSGIESALAPGTADTRLVERSEQIGSELR